MPITAFAPRAAANRPSTAIASSREWLSAASRLGLGVPLRAEIRPSAYTFPSRALTPCISPMTFRTAYPGIVSVVTISICFAPARHTCTPGERCTHSSLGESPDLDVVGGDADQMGAARVAAPSVENR